MCGREWTMHGQKNAKDNDELVWCEGGCEGWFHQDCHDPPIRPIPKGKFICSECTQSMTAEHDAQEDDEVDSMAPPPPRRVARKKQAPEPREKSKRCEASGMDKPGIHNINKNLPKRLPGGKNEGSHLDQMAWDHPLPAKKKPKKKQAASCSASPSKSPSTSPLKSPPGVPSASPSKSPKSPPRAPHEWTNVTGKRNRKKTKTFDVTKDGASDTQKKKSSSK